MHGSSPLLCRGLWISHGAIPAEPITSGMWVTAPCLHDSPERPGGCWWGVQEWDQAVPVALLEVCRGWEELPRTSESCKGGDLPSGRREGAGGKPWNRKL